MAHPSPRLLTEAELRRFEDCADENTKLADCWESQQVAVVTCEPSDYFRSYDMKHSKAIAIDVLTPIEKPVSGASRKPRQTTRQVSQKLIRVLERSKVDKRFQPKPFHSTINSLERVDMYTEDAHSKAQQTFDELAAAYVTVCIASYDLRDTTRVMHEFGIKVPPRAVFVDLIKVLEHQTRDDGIPKELRKYTDENVTMRNGRYDRRPGTPQGQLGMPSVRLLEVLGPAAVSHRADFKKIEKGSVALKRIANRARNSPS
ncbi:uncharacterized protein ColSpa_01243 [Colletotrichum spaethianum]|uniref:Uncharacterized protein n=1 Tax=Colletotrichum spaethianum TaxID=700344 RepID=A0AA37NTM5_9PEZI|nr:uncharacterized protein ColSpa_01243 [Colletotrichum spaethianum]GKT41062.1 hypothetical protein ColSpa_01243 [Colletotrichum spaethianum]